MYLVGVTLLTDDVSRLLASLYPCHRACSGLAVGLNNSLFGVVASLDLLRRDLTAAISMGELGGVESTTLSPSNDEIMSARQARSCSRLSPLRGLKASSCRRRRGEGGGGFSPRCFPCMALHTRARLETIHDDHPQGSAGLC